TSCVLRALCATLDPTSMLPHCVCLLSVATRATLSCLCCPRPRPRWICRRLRSLSSRTVSNLAVTRSSRPRTAQALLLCPWRMPVRALLTRSFGPSMARLSSSLLLLPSLPTLRAPSSTASWALVTSSFSPSPLSFAVMALPVSCLSTALSLVVSARLSPLPLRPWIQTSPLVSSLSTLLLS
ncbi:hypothetical protein H4S07_007135, partial [Coemansia furcata]